MRALLFILLFTLTNLSCQQKQEGKITVISPKEVYNALANKTELQVVDVRTSQEFKVSHLKNAQNICVTSDDFEEKVASLDKEKPVYVYCKKGGRSAQAATLLKEMGLTQVYDLQGGLENWENQGYQTVQ